MKSLLSMPHFFALDWKEIGSIAENVVTGERILLERFAPEARSGIINYGYGKHPE